MQVEICQHKVALFLLFYSMDISYYALRCLLTASPVNRLTFVVCAKGEGLEIRATGKREGISYCLSPTLLSLLPSSQSSTTFDACYAGYKHAFLLARPYAGTCWGQLIKKQVDTSRADLMGRVADRVVVSPLHSYLQIRFAYLRDELCIWDIFSSRQK